VSKRSKYGITVDIGTTNVVFHLVRLRDYSVVNQYFMKNPQIQFGADVISRIKLAQKSDDARKRLIFGIREAINRGIDGLLKEQRIGPHSVSDVVIVGNTVMHHLFFDLPTTSLLTPPYATETKGPVTGTAHEVALERIPAAQVYSPPIIGSFIGPDAVAVLLASSFLDREEIGMTIDVGTNTEVSVVTPNGVWIASAASGPAFESMTIQCGMEGERGAIKAVSINAKTFEPSLSIIDDTQPRGICGTGTISLLASLLETELLLPRGSLNRTVHSPWLSFDSDIAYFLVAPKDISSTGKDIVLSQPDVRMLQQSKAAIRATIDIVLQKSGLDSTEVKEVFLTGIFGSDLSIEDAYRIGLFPKFSNAKVIQSRNGAIRGADLLLSKTARQKIDKLVNIINHLEIMEDEEFNKLYLNALPFPSR